MTAPRTVAFLEHSTNLFFHILTQCNLKCRHCYINPAQHGETMLSFETIQAWLEPFKENNTSTNLIVLGGEPTLHPDLHRILTYAGNLGFGSITVDTNGYLFHDILSKIDPGVVDYFSFSLDGATRDTNDLIRGAGSFDACIAGINKAVSMGFASSLIFTVSSINIHELEKMGSLLKQLGIQKFFIQVIGLRGKSARMQDCHTESEHLQVSPSQWLDIVPRVARDVAELGIPAVYPRVFLESDEAFECAGLVADNYFVFPNGRVYRCPLCEDYPVHSLEFRDNSLVRTRPLNELDFFQLNIPEGCVMNKLIQPQNLSYTDDGKPQYQIACCLLKEEVGGD
ncbi:MAG: radical SAM protein [Deltaproteobacteria bacterium]|nr:radical SAM protein [Deltaproteobacteria bacterium]